jgi:hypothetical protein
MSKRRLIMYVLLIGATLTGCSNGQREEAYAGKEKTTASEKSLLPEVTSARLREQATNGESNSGRLIVGPLSFVPPKDWEVRETPLSRGITMFAPDGPGQNSAGFRSNLGVRKRPHPGVSLDRFRDLIEQGLAQSSEELNAQANAALKKSGESEGKGVALKQTGKYSLTFEQIGGARVLESKFSGLFQLPTGPIATQTYGIYLIGTDALYSVTLTFPSDAEAEMKAAWTAFRNDLRITK